MLRFLQIVETQRNRVERINDWCVRMTGINRPAAGRGWLPVVASMLLLLLVLPFLFMRGIRRAAVPPVQTVLVTLGMVESMTWVWRLVAMTTLNASSRERPPNTLLLAGA